MLSFDRTRKLSIQILFFAMKSEFLLNPTITFLNHGSFGACPKSVFEDYQNWQLELEKEPIRFITDTGVKALEISKKALANYINCDPQDLVYTTNPSYALNTVIRSLELKEGDEILTSDQEYGAMDRTWKYYCQKSGAEYIQQKIPLPLLSKEDFIASFWKGLTNKTKIVFLSQITSPTALIFPVQEICDRARELGLITIIDGAHVPGHIPLNIKKLNPDVYTGACHKWLLAPKGSSFLFVKKKLQEKIDPLIISWGYESDHPSGSIFQDYHQFQGTRDFSAFLTTPACLSFFEKHNWQEKTAKSHQELLHYYPIVAKTLNSATICALSNDFLGQICSIPIQTNNPLKLKEHLYFKENIEIPIIVFGNDIYLRISFQAYNGSQEIERLIEALNKIKKTTNLLI